MPNDNTRVYVGTIGQSVWRSDDGGETFARRSQGMPMECDIRALKVEARIAGRIWAGTEQGLYRSDDGAESWARVASSMDSLQVWSLALHPLDADTVIAGACPAALYMTEDGGKSWGELEALMPEACHGGAPLTPRVTCVQYGTDPEIVFAGVEIDGVRRSRDGGKTWEAFHEGLSSRDIHGLAIYGNGSTDVLATTNRGVNVSHDGGVTWRHLQTTADWPWQYTRWASLDPADPSAVLVGAGNGPPGNEGGLYRTPDQGQTWEKLALPRDPTNSTIWQMGLNAADPQRLYASSVSGQIFGTLDGGETWTQLPMEFGEVRGLAWEPG